MKYTPWLRRCGAVVLFAGLLFGCNPQERPQSTAPDSHQRMLTLLRQIKDRTPDEHLFLGDAVVRDTELELESLGDTGPLKERFVAYCKLGSNELRLGRNAKAVEHLLIAYKMLPQLKGKIPKVLEESAILGLAVAYLRSGETTNCVHCHTTESCIFPVQGKGVHGDPTASRKAIEYLEILLKQSPDNLQARWLLNIAYMTVGDYPDKVPLKFLIPPSAFASEEPFPKFVDVAANVNLNTFSLAGGSIADDFNNDGLLDIVVSSGIA